MKILKCHSSVSKSLKILNLFLRSIVSHFYPQFAHCGEGSKNFPGQAGYG
jgi:hypothetical protein